MCEGNVSLLPLLMEKAVTPVKIKYDMNLLRNVKEYVNQDRDDYLLHCNMQYIIVKGIEFPCVD